VLSGGVGWLAVRGSASLLAGFPLPATFLVNGVSSDFSSLLFLAQEVPVGIPVVLAGPYGHSWALVHLSSLISFFFLPHYGFLLCLSG